MKIGALLSHYAYEIVTWIFVAFSIGFFFYFFNKGDWNGVSWSLFFLVLCVIAIYVLLRVRYAKSEAPSDRAWLNVEVVPGGKIFYLQQQPGLSAFIPVIYRVTNAGRSPANSIQVKAELFLRRYKEDPREVQRRLALWEGNSFHPSVVFPAKTEEYKITYIKPISEMKEAGMHDPGQTFDGVRNFTAYVGGCISYKYEGGVGDTGFLFELDVPDGRGASIVPEIGEEIPLERWTFRRYVFGGGEWAK